MKIVLLVLGGNPEQARAWLQKSYPGATIEKTSRDQLARSSPQVASAYVKLLAPSTPMKRCAGPHLASRRIDHRKLAHNLVQELLPLSGKAIRVGITGAPV